MAEITRREFAGMGVGLGVTGVQVSDPAHRQAGQVGDVDSFVACDRDG